MAKMVGLSRNLKLPWLNEVARLYAEGLDENEIKVRLNEYLSFEITSQTNIRKTREILMNIWVYENDYTGAIKAEALRLFQKDSDYALPVHWCMMLAEYPVFQDICRLIGKISEFEETITTKQLKQKLFDEWGERSTLYHSSDKLIATLKAFEVLESPKTGAYHIKKHHLSSSEIINFMLFTMMKVDDAKCKERGENKKLTDSRREVGRFIQIIHRYRDNMLAKIKNPVENGILEIDPEKAVKQQDSGYGEVEHVAIFDEAQRSWTHKRLADYLRRGGTYGNKLKVPNFPMSEAAFLIWSLDQREDWATIVCLVGGGQEINTGEAGISEWIRALNDKFTHWKVYISPQLTEPEYAEGKVNELLKFNRNVTYSESLHLGVSLRSYRAEKLSAFVHSLLAVDDKAAGIYAQIKDKYPIILTRDMEKARRWLHEKVRGTERTGVLITKESARYKPLGIHVLQSDDDNAVHWFLDDKADTRSSNYLEDAATEIQVQGLELDYTCLLWDADMRFDHGTWHYYTWSRQKSEWTKIVADSENKQEKIKYMLNAYRVLLTRARAGMVICVPEGNAHKTASGFWEDKTRLPKYYDGTYEYLKSLGLEEI